MEFNWSCECPMFFEVISRKFWDFYYLTQSKIELLLQVLCKNFSVKTIVVKYYILVCHTWKISET